MRKLLLVFLSIFSFGVNAQLCEVISGGGYTSGDIVDVSIIPKQKPNDRVIGCNIKWEFRRGKWGTWFTGRPVSSCKADDADE